MEIQGILEYISVLLNHQLSEDDLVYINSFKIMESINVVNRRYEVNLFNVKKQLEEIISNPFFAQKELLIDLKEAIDEDKDGDILKNNILLEEYLKDKKDYISLKLKNITKIINSYLVSIRPVNGKFSYENKLITLYPNSIIESKEALVSSYEKAYQAVLSHEVFHLFHYCLLRKSKQKINKPSFEFFVVIESLAKCFEMIYCENVLKSEYLKNYTEIILKACDINYWPYAGAVNILDNFLEVFELSLKDYKKAYKIIKK